MNNIPKGYKLVPVEPTDDMIVAFAEAWYSTRQVIDDPYMLDAYRDMLAVAPTPPQPIYDEAKERELFEAWFTSVEGFWQSGGLDGRTASLNGWIARAKARAKSVEVGDE